MIWMKYSIMKLSLEFGPVQNTMIFKRINTNMIAFDWSAMMIDPCEDS